MKTSASADRRICPEAITPSPVAAAMAMVAMALLVVGCGGRSSSSSNEDQVRSVVYGYAAAIARRDYRHACSLLTRRVRVATARDTGGNGHQTCPSRFRSDLAQFTDLRAMIERKARGLRVLWVRVRGDGAFARIAVPGSSWPTVSARNIKTTCADCIAVRREDGAWRIDQSVGR